MAKLTHTDDSGKAKMVDVTEKALTNRMAAASALVCLSKASFDLINSNQNKKGDVLAVANVAGVVAAKKTAELIPLCHPLDLTNVHLDFKLDASKNTVEIIASVKTTGRTGVEMEALTAVQAALLTIYDMCKAVDRGMQMTDIRLLKKSGGKSGDWQR